jgi:hypothetical protein
MSLEGQSRKRTIDATMTTIPHHGMHMGHMGHMPGHMSMAAVAAGGMLNVAALYDGDKKMKSSAPPSKVSLSHEHHILSIHFISFHFETKLLF